MRSSWDASAMKRRSRCSDACWASKDDSIRPSMRLKAAPSCPTSVRSSVWSTRRERSPAAMAVAVRPMSFSGRRPPRMRKKALSPTPASTAALAASWIPTSRAIVCSTSSRGAAKTSVSPLGSGAERSRNRPPPTAGTVTGWWWRRSSWSNCGRGASNGPSKQPTQRAVGMVPSGRTTAAQVPAGAELGSGPTEVPGRGPGAPRCPPVSWNERMSTLSRNCWSRRS